MKQREIFITKFDKDRLDELIEVAETFGSHSRQDLQDLQKELERARIISSKEVPSNVVTMNSRVLLHDTDTSEEMTYTLVFPKDADVESGLISVLAPIGTAILGYREGDNIEWKVPSGRRSISIKKILYQPEAAGDFHL
ncbi:MAG: Regulator of nucleoside diphosphate kinase [Candidatus Jettenia ecosi]|uniref:Regulator of nucleoside diphosphate kinase n=1 Tax=Candidatus Jettenia ecosi TaxID=2494326 RepID=A0A533Q8V5_9BACT|nr:MAG: Regulator of nucleoside diphosphate kinase [Candidatus Jettenia ecosi]